jgi:hypothetical protein
VTTNDHPYRYRRHVLVVIGAAWGLLSALIPALSPPSFAMGFGLAELVFIVVGTAFCYWIGAHGVRKMRDHPFAPELRFERLLLGHSSLPLALADFCFAMWASAGTMIIAGAVCQMWGTVSFAVLSVGPTIGLYFGANVTLRADEREHWRATGRCVHCGYDLTGNTSGKCPECGSSKPGDEQTQTVASPGAETP